MLLIYSATIRLIRIRTGTHNTLSLPIINTWYKVQIQLTAAIFPTPFSVTPYLLLQHLQLHAMSATAIHRRGINRNN